MNTETLMTEMAEIAVSTTRERNLSEGGRYFCTSILKSLGREVTSPCARLGYRIGRPYIIRTGIGDNWRKKFALGVGLEVIRNCAT